MEGVASHFWFCPPSENWTTWGKRPWILPPQPVIEAYQTTPLQSRVRLRGHVGRRTQESSIAPWEDSFEPDNNHVRRRSRSRTPSPPPQIPWTWTLLDASTPRNKGPGICRVHLR